MQLLMRSLDRFNVCRQFRSKIISTGISSSFIVLLSWLSISPASAQQFISFSWEGQSYYADINWVVKHNNTEYWDQPAHQFDKSLDPSFDLVVFFKFKYDSIPGDQDLVWGFQFNQGGGLISPTSNDKRSRSLKQFQRFQLSGSGEASLTISPKVWRRNRSDQFEVVDLAPPFNLTFSVADGSLTANNTPSPADLENLSINPIKSKEIPIPVSEHAINTAAEIEAYKKAMTEADSKQKIKALIDFVDNLAPNKPKSALVAEAIKNVPLGTSLPKSKGDGTYSYTLNYAVNPVVDTNTVKGWKWNLSQEGTGQYQLTLKDLGDSEHSFKITDIGKNAPFNQPKEIRPFDKIQVALVGENSESFQLRIIGGVPPFIVFLSQDRIPKARFIITATDTLWSIKKEDCLLCKSGNHTLEVYNSDFSTLLLRADSAINIFRINYYYVGLILLTVILFIYFSYKPLTRVRQRYIYEKRLRDIDEWEQRDK